MIRVILGTLTAFVPGYLLSLIILRKLNPFERGLLSIGLSFFVIAVLGFALTGFGSLAGTKGITAASVWLSLLIVSVIFATLLLLRK